jgi:hypothetical protein
MFDVKCEEGGRRTHNRQSLPKEKEDHTIVEEKTPCSEGFRGVSVLESVVTESVEFYTSSDEIRRWSSLSEGEYCLVMLVTKRDRWESTSQGRVICEHYCLSVLMYTPVMFDFTT